jgi:hypothetical protein
MPPSNSKSSWLLTLLGKPEFTDCFEFIDENTYYCKFCKTQNKFSSSVSNLRRHKENLKHQKNFLSPNEFEEFLKQKKEKIAQKAGDSESSKDQKSEKSSVYLSDSSRKIEKSSRIKKNIKSFPEKNLSLTEKAAIFIESRRLDRSPEIENPQLFVPSKISYSLPNIHHSENESFPQQPTINVEKLNNDLLDLKNSILEMKQSQDLQENFMKGEFISTMESFLLKKTENIAEKLLSPLKNSFENLLEMKIMNYFNEYSKKKIESDEKMMNSLQKIIEEKFEKRNSEFGDPRKQKHEEASEKNIILPKPLELDVILFKFMLCYFFCFYLEKY